MSKVVVLFEVKPKKDSSTSGSCVEKYLEIAAMLKPMIVDAEGFISAERFQSLNEEGKLLSMSIWENEQAIEKWRNNLQHRMGQAEGKNSLFESYKITVCTPLREYSGTDRENAPSDSNLFFDNPHENLL